MCLIIDKIVLVLLLVLLLVVLVLVLVLVWPALEQEATGLYAVTSCSQLLGYMLFVVKCDQWEAVRVSPRDQLMVPGGHALG